MGAHIFVRFYLPGISVTAPIRRSTPWAFIRKIFPFVPTIEMSTLFAFPSKNQLNAQGAVTENPGSAHLNACECYVLLALSYVKMTFKFSKKYTARDIEIYPPHISVDKIHLILITLFICMLNYR